MTAAVDLTAPDTVKAVVEYLDRHLHSAEKTLTEFTDRLGRDAEHAFRWSPDAFAAAARDSAYRKLRGIVTHTGVQGAVNFAAREALQAARYPPSSTSPCANLMDALVASAYAHFVDDLPLEIGQTITVTKLR